MLTSESKEPYLAAFKQMRAAGAFSGPAWLEHLRQAGIASFDGLGFPTLKNEDWKYTNVEPIAAQSYVQPNGEVQSVSALGFCLRRWSKLMRRGWCSSTAFTSRRCQARPICRRGCAWGHWRISSSRTTGSSLMSWAGTPAPSGSISLHSIPRFSAMARWLRWRRTAGLKGRSICCSFLLRQSEPVISHPRILLLLGAGSEAKIVESYLGVGGKAYFCNAVTELVGGADSVVEHFRLQQESDNGFHVGALEANLARGCHLIGACGDLERRAGAQ